MRVLKIFGIMLLAGSGATFFRAGFTDAFDAPLMFGIGVFLLIGAAFTYKAL